MPTLASTAAVKLPTMEGSSLFSSADQTDANQGEEAG
jgi:hypothetical protein